MQLPHLMYLFIRFYLLYRANVLRRFRLQSKCFFPKK